MITISVLAVTTIAEALGGRRHKVTLPDSSTVEAALRRLGEGRSSAYLDIVFDKNGNFNANSVVILWNGRSILACGGIDRPLADGDELVIMPLMAGG